MFDFENRNSRTARRLFVVAAVMFGFGYALIPLYDVFCEVTGLNGKTGVITEKKALAVSVDQSRTIKIQFVTGVSVGMPWEFRPLTKEIKVVPGVLTTAEFEAINTADRPVTGSAVPSVSPPVASKYLSKTDCFCFIKQRLESGEKRVMPVVFLVDSRIPRHVDTLTLSYTFFPTISPSDKENES